MTNQLYLTEPQKDAEMKRVGELMAQHTVESLIGLYEIIDRNYGHLAGSGIYIAFGAEPYVLTAAHVYSDHRSLAVYRGPGRPPFLFENPTQCIGAEIDLALCRLGRNALTQIADRTPLNPKRLADNSNAEGDFIFIHGYPGISSRYSHSMNSVISNSLPYITVLSEFPLGLQSEHIDPKTHFAVAFSPIGNKDHLDRDCGLPDPHGLSGSAVWATRRNKYPGRNWTANNAEVIGIVQKWHQQERCLLVLRSEVIRNIVHHFLQREVAYFNWQERRVPIGDDWVDWFKASKIVKEMVL
jgi:hypothetical protein